MYKHKHPSWLYNVFKYSNSGFLGLQLDLQNSSAQKFWQEVEFIFGKDLINLGLPNNFLWIMDIVSCIWTIQMEY